MKYGTIINEDLVVFKGLNENQLMGIANLIGVVINCGENLYLPLDLYLENEMEIDEEIELK